MRTILPRAAVATVVASALGVGMFLFPLDASGLIGDPRVERGAHELDTLVSAIHPRPGGIDGGVARVTHRDALPAGATGLVLANELLMADGTHSPPELVRTLEMMRSMQEFLQSRPGVATGARVESRALSLSSADLLELVVLVEDFLRSMVRTPEPDLAELLTNVLVTVAGGLETPDAAAVVTPPPTAEADTPFPRAPAVVAPTPVPAEVEPASEPPEFEPPAVPAAPMPTPQVNPTSGAPSLDVGGAGDPPQAEVTSQPSRTVEVESDEETAVSSQPAPQDPAESAREPDNPDSTSNNAVSERNPLKSDKSPDGNGAEGRSPSQEKDASPSE